MSEEEVHAILNLEKYALHIRRRAALSFSEQYEENLDDFVTTKQVCDMIGDYAVGKDAEDRYLLDTKGYENLFEAIKTRLYNCGLSKLAAKDMLECAWDEKKNEMVFWSKGQSTE